jgi:hypothetical protein
VSAAQSNNLIRTWYAFEGSWGAVVHNKRFFFAWKEGCLMGTYNTLEDAMESLASKQAKDTVRGITAENAGKAKRKRVMTVRGFSLAKKRVNRWVDMPGRTSITTP